MACSARQRSARALVMPCSVSKAPRFAFSPRLIASFSDSFMNSLVAFSEMTLPLKGSCETVGEAEDWLEVALEMLEAIEDCAVAPCPTPLGAEVCCPSWACRTPADKSKSTAACWAALIAFKIEPHPLMRPPGEKMKIKRSLNEAYLSASDTECRGNRC